MGCDSVKECSYRPRQLNFSQEAMLSDEVKVLVKAGYMYPDMTLSDKGYSFLNAKMFGQFYKEMLEAANAEIAARN
jgi:hypothetical protein